MRADALLATNTSSIPLDELSPALASPGRLVGIHFFNPVARMQLVEIVTGDTTDASEAARAAAFTRSIDRLPLPVRSSPGFLVNRVLTPYLLEAITLEAEGVPATEIDRAAVAFGMPMGPIELGDTVGLDICLSVAKNLAQTLPATIPDKLQALVDAGHLGRKSGRGYYEYKHGKTVKPRASGSFKAPADLIDRLIMRYLNEAAACLREGVVADADLVDAGLIFGTGFAPFQGGPMHYARQQSIEMIRETLDGLATRYGDRFDANEGWSLAGSNLFDRSGVAE